MLIGANAQQEQEIGIWIEGWWRFLRSQAFPLLSSYKEPNPRSFRTGFQTTDAPRMKLYR